MDKYNLNRFSDKQTVYYDIALKEIIEGLKVSHWIWFIFPQLDGIVENSSTYTKYYSISSLDEAKEYYEDKNLRAHLREITIELLNHRTKDIESIVGDIDALKIRSCMTLFNRVSPDDIFQKVIDQFYNGEEDELTINELNKDKTNA